MKTCFFYAEAFRPVCKLTNLESALPEEPSAMDFTLRHFVSTKWQRTTQKNDKILVGIIFKIIEAPCNFVFAGDRVRGGPAPERAPAQRLLAHPARPPRGRRRRRRLLVLHIHQYLLTLQEETLLHQHLEG